jgi:hypothetical protein
MAQTHISHFWAVGERDIFDLGAAFTYLSKCHVTYDLQVEARLQVIRGRMEEACSRSKIYMGGSIIYHKG